MITLRNDGFSALAVKQHELKMEFEAKLAQMEQDREFEGNFIWPTVWCVVVGLALALNEYNAAPPWPPFF